ncbi:hypothetical protein ATCV1_z473L [Acanthocystis turfacea chlorella virus 1]|uniref:Uncharacterized protein z473L n=1 Tax=Chlorovirus heliozoae TaxID=322019 RepID=A7K983_9PHYC|nr:hypothetical protein ATCV1_z473L [Acanthocystis turfacea chlorella virus 1]ABT16607.1 hypothetical protein ATCV1_z473L [Acanthocystis turfacea chlorella virus 1]
MAKARLIIAMMARPRTRYIMLDLMRATASEQYRTRRTMAFILSASLWSRDGIISEGRSKSTRMSLNQMASALRVSVIISSI